MGRKTSLCPFALILVVSCGGPEDVVYEVFLYVNSRFFRRI